MSGLKQHLQQQLLLKLGPHQIQLMRLIQLPAIALEQRIKEEIESNPALEESADEEEEPAQNEENENTEDDAKEDEEDNSKDDEFDVSDYMDEDEIPAYRLSAKNTGPDEEIKVTPVAVQRSFHENLIAQLGLREFDDQQYLTGEYLIGNIDDDGYIRRELAAIADDLAFTQNRIISQDELNSVLKIIQEFDPPGVGARNLQECLLIQLNRKQTDKGGFKNSIQIITRCFDEFTKKNYEKIGRDLQMSDWRLKKAIREITRLNPRPGSSANESGREAVQIMPDFVIYNNDNSLEVQLTSSNMPELHVSRTYKEMLSDYSAKKEKNSAAGKQAVQFVKDKLDRAKMFIDMIRERQNTLLRTMTAIMEYQKDYFLSGDESRLKPMILKDIAAITGYDISTISRVSNSKYVQTSFGTLPVKSFFSEALRSDNEGEVSSKKVKKLLHELIDKENRKKPLTDDKLSKLLKEKGFPLARRTTAKYREMMKIAPARLRKKP